MKEYRSKAFQTRIEVNLANISSSPEDEFKLHTAYYDTNTFDCDLCGHKGCVYAFEVKNIETDKILKVGSECIHHFEGKGVDIDLAEGLMKRVMQVTQKARNKLIKEIGKEEYKKLSKDEKRQKITKQYIIEQTKELLTDVAKNKAILTEEQVQRILDLGLKDEYEEAKEKRDEQENWKKANAILTSFEDYIGELKKNWEEVDEERIEEFRNEYSKYSRYHNANMIDVYLKNYRRQLEVRDKYDWLFNYNGSNQTILDIKSQLERKGSVSDRQANYAQSLMQREKNTNHSKIQEAFDYFSDHSVVDRFISSLKNQYDKKGFLSEKQEKALIKIYTKKKATLNL